VRVVVRKQDAGPGKVGARPGDSHVQWLRVLEHFASVREIRTGVSRYDGP
jgi:hypothetical protein